MISWSPLIPFDNTVELITSLNPRLSKTAAKKMIKAHKVARRAWVEKKKINLPIEIVNHGLVNPCYSGRACEILYEDDSWLAISKVESIHTHPLDYHCSENSLSFLASIGKLQALKVNQDNYDRGLLYRLDFETSGVLILAKNKELYTEMRESFSELAREKKYLALVSGDANSIIGIQKHFMKPSSIKGHKMIEGCSEDLSAKLIVKEVNFRKETNQSLLEIDLKTGHRHQIRFQLFQLGFPIIGDYLYGGGYSSRLYLHALSYQISNLNIKSEIPAEFLP